MSDFNKSRPKMAAKFLFPLINRSLIFYNRHLETSNCDETKSFENNTSVRFNDNWQLRRRVQKKLVKKGDSNSVEWPKHSSICATHGESNLL